MPLLSSRAEPEFVIAPNEPWLAVACWAIVGRAMGRSAARLRAGRDPQDLISDEAGQREWAASMPARIMASILAGRSRGLDLKAQQYYGLDAACWRQPSTPKEYMSHPTSGSGRL